jgi:predicted membrane protein
MEHPKYNGLCVLVCRIILKKQGPQALGIFISRSVSLLFFSKNSLLGLFFLITSVWQILFYLLAHCVYISSFEKRIRRREEQTRSRDKTHDRRPARLKRNARSVLLCRALLLYLLSVFASRETRKEELKRENCL